MAELGALETCVSGRLVPLVEVIAPKDASKAIERAWPHAADVIWLHSLNFEDEEEPTFASNIEKLFKELRGRVPAVPVITVTEGPDTLAAVKRIVTVDSGGVVLRLDVEEILDDAIDTSASIRATLDALGLFPSQVDVVVDAGLLEGAHKVQAAVAEQCVRALPDLADWRTVVIAFSGFPSPLSEVVPVSTVRAVPRTDAAAFATARRRLTDRAIVFGDYTLGTPGYDSVPFTPIPNIRYASGAEWVIHRAAQRKGPADQFRALATALVAAPYFAGAAFSPGDRQIADVASRASGPGNPTTHLRAGISRHVHVVLERLATLGEP
jgi:hypothetical protein